MREGFMSIAERVYIGVDRRMDSLKGIELWDLLSPEQQFSACSLGQAGYLLSFVRRLNDCYLAVLTNGSKVATIDCQGHINTSIKLKMR